MQDQSGRIRIIVAAVLVVAAGLFWFYSERIGEPPPEEPAVAPEPVQHPVPAPRPPAPQPEAEPAEDPGEAPGEVEPDEIVLAPERQPAPEPRLEDSDPLIRRALEEVVGPEEVERFLVDERLVERTVVAAVSLDAGPIPLRLRPMIHVPGLPRIGGSPEEPVLTGAPDPRYAPFVERLEALDLDALAQLYFTHYELFQQAYEDLGHPAGYFNDRLVGILDHLIATELPEYPVALTRPEVLYEYADEDLEADSWGRKILYRLGPEYAPTVQARLREFRALITGGAE